MQTTVEPQEIAFDAHTLVSFVPELPTGDARNVRAIPLVVIGCDRAGEPTLVWLVPPEGIDPRGLTSDPYYEKLLRDPRAYFRRKLAKYVDAAGSVRRGISMLVNCHQQHLTFTEFAPRTDLELVATA